MSSFTLVITQVLWEAHSYSFTHREDDDGSFLRNIGTQASFHSPSARFPVHIPGRFQPSVIIVLSGPYLCHMLSENIRKVAEKMKSMQSKVRWVSRKGKFTFDIYTVYFKKVFLILFCLIFNQNLIH